MIFLTVGSEIPFDRLVRAVDELAARAALREEVFAQVGRGGYVPRNFPSVELVERGEYDKCLRQCRAVISHAGMGTIMKCMEMEKPLLAVPRRKQFGEIVSDHQLGTARTFESQGDLLVAYDTNAIVSRLPQLFSFRPPSKREGPQEVIRCIRDFLQSVK
jgi:UDP-N-acetylglucosamine transferase subunit ALG13